jgi:RNA polymerase II subunit A small phosphatase-like protein
MAIDGPGSAATGLSGETIKGSAESVGRGSKRSFMGKRRAGSTASSHPSHRAQVMTEKAPSMPDDGTTAATSPTSPLAKPEKKAGCFRSLFACFGQRSTDDGGDANRPSTSSRRKDRVPVPAAPEQAESETTEPKDHVDAQVQTTSQLPIFSERPPTSHGQGADGVQLPIMPDTRPGRRTSKPEPRLETSHHTLSPESPSGPHIAVQAPTPITPSEEIIHDRTPEQEQRDAEIEMTDGGATVPLASNEVAGFNDQSSASADGTRPPGKRDSKAKIDLPPPPPLQERQAQVAHHEGSPVGEGPDGVQNQKWLLPPKKAEFAGKKCLVLDLDETLVHSSFKVGIFLISAAMFMCVRGNYG